jgi:D-3-phosphoglycerate dehydrogenase / 2-oxoglutarate reductase
MSFKVLVTTIPFGQNNSLPLDILERAGAEFEINPLGRKLKEEDLFELIDEYDALIAGTEKISKRTLTKTGKLKLISRVGVGLDGINLAHAVKNGVTVSYTAEAPAPAVAELTIGLILNQLRSIGTINTQMHSGNWERIFGRRIEEVTIGIVGLGRIGKRVHKIIQGFGCKNILLNDLNENSELKGIWCDLETLLKESDVVTLHVPLTSKTKNIIAKKELIIMKESSVLINTARGGIINENDLYQALKNDEISSAAIDVFEKEPYEGGDLSKLANCTLTSHMGSMSKDCRERMEIEACEEVERFIKGTPLKNEVPSSEVEMQQAGESHE